MLEMFDKETQTGYNDEGLYSMSQLSQLLSTKWAATKYLMAEGVIECPKRCIKCGYKMGWKKDPYETEVKFSKNLICKPVSAHKDCFTFRCKNRKCSYTFSAFTGSFFANKKKPANEILMCLHLWLAKANMPILKALTGWDEKTVLLYCQDFRRMVTRFITDFIDMDVPEELFTYEQMVGGPNQLVQLDESAFGKRKYGKGHHVDTKWVFGGVEIISDQNGRQRGGKFFAVVVPDRTAKTLLSAIKKWIRPGSIIISDCWAGYNKVEDLPNCEFQHFKVCHDRNYVDPDTGCHTNTIEGKWNGIKKAIPRQAFRKDKVLQEYLAEQMWRNTNKGHLWEAIITSMRFYINKEI